MTAAPPALRRMALAVAVLYDVDLYPVERGLVLTGPPEVMIDWKSVAEVLDATRSVTDTSERHQLDGLAHWLRARRAVAAKAQLVVFGAPLRHPDHPGRAWIRERIPGGALSLGFGYVTAEGSVTSVPAGVLEHAGIHLAGAWRSARTALEELGELAARRDRRHIDGAILPWGSADVVTLLGARTLRSELASGEGDGLAALIVPLRTRGWRASRVSDPAYGPALAAAMPLQERGFERPLLVTAEELTEVRAGGDPMRGLRADYETG